MSARPHAILGRGLLAALSFAALTGLGIPCAQASHCTEVSDIVGHEECLSYGDGWDIAKQPRMQLTLGADRFESTVPNLLLPDGTIASSGPVSIYGGHLQITYDPIGPLFVGGWMEIGFGSGLSPSFHPLATNSNGYTPSAGVSNMGIGGVALVGTTLGPLYVAGGARLGGSLTQVGYGKYGPHANQGEWLVEPEVSVSTWLGSIVTLGVTVGDDVTHTGVTGWQGGVDLTFHILPFEES
jgi:hypothetical protein